MAAPPSSRSAAVVRSWSTEADAADSPSRLGSAPPEREREALADEQEHDEFTLALEQKKKLSRKERAAIAELDARCDALVPPAARHLWVTVCSLARALSLISFLFILSLCSL